MVSHQRKKMNQERIPLANNPQQLTQPIRAFCDGRFEYLDKLGEGSYGKVYKVIDRNTRTVVALKKVKFHGDKNQGIPQSSLRELAILKEVSNPNIIKLFDIIGSRDGNKELYLVFEMADMDLRKYIQVNNHKLSKSRVKHIMFDLCKGIDYLHKQRIIHRDIKPENILLNKDGDNIKIADFGLSRTIHMPLRPYSREILSLWYRSPELCLGYKNYSIGVDLWALGCVFYELVTGHPLFRAKSDTEMILKIFEQVGTPTGNKWAWVTKITGYSANFPIFPGKGFSHLSSQMDQEGIDLLARFLDLDPLQRITCNQAIDHPYFKELNNTS